MSRVHISTDDLTRLRVAARLSSEIEGVLALDVLMRVRAAEYGTWRSQVRAGLGAMLPEVRELAGRLPTLAEKLDNFGYDSAVRSTGASGTRDAEIMAAFREIAIRPYWGQIRAHLETVSDTCCRIGMTVGIERLLSVLHSTVQWSAPTLTIRDGIDRDIELSGRGLVLTPSFFLAGNNTLLLDGESDTPTLVFAVTVDPDLAVREDAGQSEQCSLSALLGHTRAAALRELTTSHTTGELSARLGISLAGVSKHTAVLRRAGLITTSRIRNTAVHSVTSLGMALLNKKNHSRSCGKCLVDNRRLSVPRISDSNSRKVNLT